MTSEQDVLQIVSSMRPFGGIQRVAFELARRFRKHGVKLKSRTLHPVDPGLDADLGEVFPCKTLSAVANRIPHKHLQLLFQLPLFSVLATISALRERRALRLVHGESFAGDVFVAHSCHQAALRAKASHGSMRWIFYPLHHLWVLREIVVFRRRRPPLLVALSRGVAREFHELYGVPAERIISIPNGVDRNTFRPATDKRALRSRLGLPVDKTLILFVGHEFERKGLRPIMEGVASARGADRCDLVVVGRDRRGPYQSLADSLGLGRRTHFLGARPNVPDFMAASDLFVMLSNYESCPLVGLEALASGLPVITTRVSGMEDYVKEEVNGLFVTRDAKSTAAALERILGDRDLFERLSAAARPSTEDYDWDRIAERYMKLLSEIRRPGSAG
jgi:glycosyltransferase involved in cell wall biosynthesis